MRWAFLAQAVGRFPFPALLGKVARRAGWGMDRRLRMKSDCTGARGKQRRFIPAFHAPCVAFGDTFPAPRTRGILPPKVIA